MLYYRRISRVVCPACLVVDIGHGRGFGARAHAGGMTESE